MLFVPTVDVILALQWGWS